MKRHPVVRCHIITLIDGKVIFGRCRFFVRNCGFPCDPTQFGNQIPDPGPIPGGFGRI